MSRDKDYLWGASILMMAGVFLMAYLSYVVRVEPDLVGRAMRSAARNGKDLGSWFLLTRES